MKNDDMTTLGVTYPIVFIIVTLTAKDKGEHEKLLNSTK